MSPDDTPKDIECAQVEIINQTDLDVHLRGLVTDFKSTNPQGPVEDWMVMESRDSIEVSGADGASNPYASSSATPY